MENQTKFRIDGTKINSLDDFFREISQLLFPEVAEWKYNFDGLDDMLSGGFGSPEDGCVIFWDNHKVSRTALGYEETIRVLEQRLLKSHSTARNDLIKRIRMAERREGPTIFDDIIELFDRHRPEENQKYSVDLRLR